MSHRFRSIVIALAIVAGACSAAVDAAPIEGSLAPVTPEASPSLSADPAPAVSLTFFDGSTGTLADFRGRPVVLNFWASWCPACVAELPDFEAVHRSLGDDVVFIGVDLQDPNREIAQRLIDETGVSYLLADDPAGTVFADFGGFAMPTTIFIDADGTIVGRNDGAIFEDQLVDRIASLFGPSS